MKAFKVFAKGLYGAYQGGFKYPEKGWAPRKTPKLCVSGYHIPDKFSDVGDFFSEDRDIYLVEVRGSFTRSTGNKTAFSQVKALRNLKITKSVLKRWANITNVALSEWNCPKDNARLLQDILVSLPNNKKLLKSIVKHTKCSERLILRSARETARALKRLAAKKVSV